jgi:hypothetical protein
MKLNAQNEPLNALKTKPFTKHQTSIPQFLHPVNLHRAAAAADLHVLSGILLVRGG